jgi:hypothetical protein
MKIAFPGRKSMGGVAVFLSGIAIGRKGTLNVFTTKTPIIIHIKMGDINRFRNLAPTKMKYKYDEKQQLIMF